jgi:hypothetical protein
MDSMKRLLFYELVQFSFSMPNAKEKIKYSLLSLIYFFFLSSSISLKSKHGPIEPETTGDDIYPLF